MFLHVRINKNHPQSSKLKKSDFHKKYFSSVENFAFLGNRTKGQSYPAGAAAPAYVDGFHAIRIITEPALKASERAGNTRVEPYRKFLPSILLRLHASVIAGGGEQHFF